MFSKRECRVYIGVRREQIYAQTCDFWTRQGFFVAQVSPYNIQGQSYFSKIGLRREFYLTLGDNGNGTIADLTLNARISDEGMVGGAAAAVLFFPVAVIGGAMSYTEYESDAGRLISSFWFYMDQVARTPGAIAAVPVATVQPVQVVQVQNKPCIACGALLPESWKACPYCGKIKG
jgi:hypothetical protein